MKEGIGWKGIELEGREKAPLMERADHVVYKGES